MRRMAAACLVLLLMTGPTDAEDLPGVTEGTRAAAQKLAQAVGVEHQVGQVLELMRGQMVLIMQKGAPGKSPTDINRTVDDIMLPEFRARLGEVTAAIVEIYASNYSAADMKELREFYATPLGQRLLKVSPIIAQQSFAAGRQWGEQVAKDALRKNAEELRRRGITL